MRVRVKGAMAGLAACVAFGFVTADARAGNWDDSFRVSSVATSESGVDKFTAAADEAGNFLHVWTQIEPSNVGIELKIFSQVSHTDGSNGQIHEVFNSPADAWVQEIDVSRGPDGTGHLVWRESETICTPGCSTTDFVRYLKLDASGQPIGNLHTLTERANDEGSTASRPKVDTDGNGITRIAWFEFDGLTIEGRVAMLLVPEGGSPLADFNLRSGDDWSGIDGLDLDSNSEGDTVVAWSGDPETDKVVESILVGSDGSVPVEAESLYTSPDSINSLQAVIDEAGKSTVAFLEIGSVNTVLARQTGSNGQALGANAIKISDPADTGAELSSDGLTVAPDGTAYLAWTQIQSPPGQPGIRTRLISPAGVPGPVVEAVPPAAGVNLLNPLISSGPEGGLLAYVNLPIAGPENEVDSFRAVELSPDGTPTGTTMILDTVGSAADTIWAESLLESGRDAGLFWRNSRDEVSFYGEIFGSIWDGTSPVVTLWAPPEATEGQELLIAAQSVDRSDVEFTWSVNGSPVVADGAFLRHTFATVGVNTVQVEVTDSAGNQTVEEVTIQVAAVPDPPEPPEPPVPPNTLINSKPVKSTKSRAATFKFISSLTGSKFECRLDKAGWSDCKSPKKLKKLKPGKHTFRVRAIKGDLLDKSPATYSWNVTKKKR